MRFERRILIEVTQEDINAGIRAATKACPVAFALQRATQDKDASVGAFGIYVILDQKKFTADLPLVVRKFIRDFDYGYEVKPFSFYIEDWYR